MIFTRDQAAQILAGRTTAALIRHAPDLAVPTIQPLKRQVVRRDGDGAELDTETQVVMEGDADDRRPVVLTIVSADTVWLWELTKEHIGGTGYRTLDGLKAAWRAAHPIEDRATLIRFELGDQRDRPRFLAPAGGHITYRKTAPATPGAFGRWTVADNTPDQDYTGRGDELDAGEAVTDIEQQRQTRAARKQEADRSKDPDARLYHSLQRELERWEMETGGVTSRDRHEPIKAIRRQLAALDRKLKGGVKVCLVEATPGTPVGAGVDYGHMIGKEATSAKGHVTGIVLKVWVKDGALHGELDVRQEAAAA